VQLSGDENLTTPWLERLGHNARIVTTRGSVTNPGIV